MLPSPKLELSLPKEGKDEVTERSFEDKRKERVLEQYKTIVSSLTITSIASLMETVAIAGDSNSRLSADLVIGASEVITNFRKELSDSLRETTKVTRVHIYTY